MEKLEHVEVRTFDEYQKAAMRTCTESSRNIKYMILEIVSEAGEVAGKVAKMIRDDNGKITDKRREEILSELGDVMWGVAGLATIKHEDLENTMMQSLSSFDCSKHMKDYIYGFKNEGYAELSAQLLSISADMAVFALSIGDDRWIGRFMPIVELVAIIAGKLGYSLQEVCQHNIDKLTDRYNRNVIQGSGDSR